MLTCPSISGVEERGDFGDSIDLDEADTAFGGKHGNRGAGATAMGVSGARPASSGSVT
ncbi:MAG: hypothetical protein ACFB6R_13200 [Alphaproteobacteria bacterium]